MIYKIGDDFASIANAARRFLDQQDRMDARIQNVFAGHLRAICGSLTVEELIRERDKLTEATRGASGTEMEKLGLIVDSLQIQEIDDPTGYIENLARPFAAVVQRDARIAQAQADQEASTREQRPPRSRRHRSATARSSSPATRPRSTAPPPRRNRPARSPTRPRARRSSSKRPRSPSSTRRRPSRELLVDGAPPGRRQGLREETIANAQRNADIAAAEARAKQIELQAQADATPQARRRRRLDPHQMIGEAEGSATRAKGSAEGDAISANGLAEAQAIKARADALAQNQEAVIGQQLAEQWPQIVEAAAKAFNKIDQMIVLNGAEGISEMLGKVMAQGVAGLDLARNLLARTKSGAGLHHAAGAQRRRRDRQARPSTQVSLWRRIVRLIAGEARSQIARLDDPAASVDAAYRMQLEIVDEVRRHLADLLTARKRLEMQVAVYERDGAQREAVEAFRAEIDELRGREDALGRGRRASCAGAPTRCAPSATSPRPRRRGERRNRRARRDRRPQPPSTPRSARCSTTRATAPWRCKRAPPRWPSWSPATPARYRSSARRTPKRRSTAKR